MDVARTAISAAWAASVLAAWGRVVWRAVHAGDSGGVVARVRMLARSFGPSRCDWPEMLAAYGLVNGARFVLLQPDWMATVFEAYSPATLLQVAALMGGTTMFYILVQLSARHWGRGTAADGTPRTLRRTLTRAEMRTLMGMTLFATLADLVFVAHGTGTALGAPARLLSSRLPDFEGAVFGRHTRGADGAEFGKLTGPQRLGVENSGGPTPPGAGDYIGAPGDRADAPVLGAESHSQALDALMDALPATAVRLTVLLLCAWTAVQQLRQVRYFQRMLGSSARREAKAAGGGQLGHAAKARRYRLHALYHVLQILALLCAMGASACALASAAGRAGAYFRNVGRRRVPSSPSGDWHGVSPPSAEDQAVYLGHYVFWLTCSFAGLL